MCAYSPDVRDKIVSAVERKPNKHEVAGLFGVSVSSVKRYVKQWQEEGCLDPKPHPGRLPHYPPGPAGGLPGPFDSSFMLVLVAFGAMSFTYMLVVAALALVKSDSIGELRRGNCSLPALVSASEGLQECQVAPSRYVPLTD